jgi:hypothetical protein
MRWHTALLVTLVVGACTSSSTDARPRYLDPNKAYTVVQPDAWSPSIVRGLAELRRTDTAHARHTIVIRASERPASIIDGKATTREDVLASTTKALVALPGASVASPKPVADAGLPATRFSLTFQPRGLSARYRREHAVLVGAKHLYHVIYTAPAGEPIDERAFSTMVTTLTEGV